MWAKKPEERPARAVVGMGGRDDLGRGGGQRPGSEARGAEGQGHLPFRGRGGNRLSRVREPQFVTMATDPENWGPFAMGVKAGSMDAFIFSFFPDSGLGWQTVENRTCQSDGHSAEVPRRDQHHRLPQSLGVSGAFERVSWAGSWARHRRVE